ncbi:MAG: 30S ribosomal protein S5 [Patescibacteria group bacterium]
MADNNPKQSQAGQTGGQRQSRGGRRGGEGERRRRDDREDKEFEQSTLDLARVTRVTAGGKRMRFRAALIVGDRKGRVGLGVAKGADVQLAMQKALRQAKKNMTQLALVGGTFPHASSGHFGPADVLLMPAPKGTGLKSGGAVRVIMELAGVGDAVSKILGSSNKINVAKATFAALADMRIPEGQMTDIDNAAAVRKEKREEAAKKVTKKKSGTEADEIKSSEE